MNKCTISKIKCNLRNVKTRAINVQNYSAPVYLCKPEVVYINKESKPQRELHPLKCKLIYLECDSRELCKLNEIFESVKFDKE